MSLDRSLRVQSSLVRHRNVLSRAERIAILMERGWDPAKSGALHLPKVPHRKVKAGKKKGGKQEAAAAEQQA